MEEILGTVENIIFESDDGMFTVLKLRLEHNDSMAHATVNLPAPLLGEQVKLSGMWIQHAKFGEQFKAEAMERIAPTTLAGIERFLASGVIKGIGSSMAKRLVAEFGEKTLEIIEFQPRKLEIISGIGKKKAAAIHESYGAQAELREVVLFLEMHGVSGAYAAKIFAQYGSFAVDRIKKDPYCLARDIDGIGFRTADQIAAAVGIERFSEARIAAGIDFALLQISSAGHCCVPEGVLIAETAKLIAVKREDTAAVLKHLLQENRLCTLDVDGATLVYPPHLYHAEEKTAHRLLYLQSHARVIDCVDADSVIAAWEATAHIALAKRQREALQSVLEHGVLVLTGGPGTGKTTVIKGMIAVLEQQGLKILLGAPTGRAAKRLSEATGRRAVTVHRLLESTGVDAGIPMFSRDSDEPLDADVIILDEVSMMDILLMHYFLEAVAKGCRVVFVGDVDQLPAVGPGAVLKDILRSEAVPSVYLNEIFRQTHQSMIAVNAHAVNRGAMPVCSVEGEFQLREFANSEEAAQAIVSLCTKELPERGIDVRYDVQVLSPMHRFACGVENLNRLLQDALNPAEIYKASATAAGQVFREGDKVMQIRNNYIKQVFNGDIGYIETIAHGKVTVRYPDLDVDYESNEIIELRLAYAMSVHKSQGSEYPIVILPLAAEHHIMLQRNLLYTAITRAKKQVILLGGKSALYTAVTNDKTKRRYTQLAERLKNYSGV